MQEVRTRFAPSPTGYLHIGGLRTALYAYLFAKQNNGKFILRIEDTDLERYVDGAVEIIYDTLKDAGLIYDEGPDVGGDYGPYVQSERKDMYLPYAKELVEKGKAYYCFCTKEDLDARRAEAEARGETFKYDKHCLHLSKEEIQRRLDAGEPYVIRQNIPESGEASFDDVLYGHISVDCSELDDNVLIKAEGGSVMLTTTNLELGIRCSIKAEVEEAGEITLPVKKLAAIINSMPQQEVTVESADGQTARIRSGRSDFNRFNGLKAEDFPALPSFVDQHSYELPPQELALMLRSVSYAQSTDENRYILNSVFFSFSEGKLSLVATDGRRLALISRDMKIDREDEGSIILPAKTVTELEKLLSQGKMVKISFSDRQVAFDIEVGEESANNGLSGSQRYPPCHLHAPGIG